MGQKTRSLIGNAAGFTLVELVTVIVVIGILAAMGVAFMTRPIEGYVDLERRAELADTAEQSLRRMQRDIRHALPNSIRVSGGGTRVELLHTVDGGRYRAGGADRLDFTLADGRFDVLGQLSAAPTPGHSLVVYNLSGSGASGNAYNAAGTDNRALVGAGSTTNAVVLNPAHRFPRSSPQQRFFIVDEPVTYRCDTGAETLTRHSGYAIAPAPVIGAGDLLARHVTGCVFTYNGGTSQRAGLLSLELTLSDQGESVRLLHQVHVINSP